VIDLHCHILPGVDDGPRTLGEALAVARLLAADGVTHVAATPHCHRHLRLLRDDILPRVERFNDELRGEGIPLAVLPGSEIQLTDVAAYRRDYEAGVLCHLGDRPDFTLLEFPWQEKRYPAGVAEQVRWLRGRGTTPLVAHPERHDYFRDDPGRLAELAHAGAWLQVTVDSLLERNGPEVRAAAEAMLAAYRDCVLATDAHGPQRCSGLAVGYRVVGDRLGPERAEELRERSELILGRLLSPQASARGGGEGRSE
jgi:protein-tyrosine phosphatase